MLVERYVKHIRLCQIKIMRFILCKLSIEAALYCMCTVKHYKQFKLKSYLYWVLLILKINAVSQISGGRLKGSLL